MAQTHAVTLLAMQSFVMEPSIPMLRHSVSQYAIRMPCQKLKVFFTANLFTNM